MSEFRNVTEVTLGLTIDGQPYMVDAGGTVKIPDEFDYQLDYQPSWEPVDPGAAAASEARKAPFASDGSVLEAVQIGEVGPEIVMPLAGVKVVPVKSNASVDAPVQDPSEGEN